MASRLTALIIAFAAVIATSCKPAPMPQLHMLSDQEAADLWKQAESFEPIGKASVQRIPHEGGLTVVCGQAYMLRMSGGRPGSQVVTSCGGSCKLKPGATFDDCKTSGCLASGQSCTPLNCEGGCTLSEACKPTFSFGFAMQ